MQTVRIRNKPTIRKLTIPTHKIDAIKYIKQNVIYTKSRNSTIKDILGHSLCSMCSEVPSIEISYDLGGLRKVEYYCESCISKVYERDDPEDRDELAEKYGCVIGELPKTPPAE